MKKIYNCFIKNNVLYTSLIVMYFMIFVIIYNFFCHSIGMDMEFKIQNIKHIFFLEEFSYIVYTYLGLVLTLCIMEDDYKQILVISIPTTILIYLIKDMYIGQLIIIFFFFLYRYLKRNEIISTLGYLVFICLLQCIFYYFKYDIFDLDYESIKSSVIRLFLGLDYYLFLGIVIIINKARK